MNVSIPINVYLKEKQYKAVKELGKRIDKPYSEIVRRGVDLVLDEYDRQGDANGKQNP